MIRLEINPRDLTSGLEIHVKGFKGETTAEKGQETQVFIEVYEGQLQIHTWDGSGEDPVTVIIEKENEHEGTEKDACGDDS